MTIPPRSSRGAGASDAVPPGSPPFAVGQGLPGSTKKAGPFRPGPSTLGNDRIRRLIRSYVDQQFNAACQSDYAQLDPQISRLARVILRDETEKEALALEKRKHEDRERRLDHGQATEILHTTTKDEGVDYTRLSPEELVLLAELEAKARAQGETDAPPVPPMPPQQFVPAPLVSVAAGSLLESGATLGAQVDSMLPENVK